MIFQILSDILAKKNEGGALLLLFFFFVLDLHAQFTSKPTWKDEFSTDGTPNKEMWERSITSPGKKLSSYCDSDENAYVRHGKLHLRLIKNENVKKPYTSGRVVTNREYLFNKGKIEVRAKVLRVFPGAWYAIWFGGANTKDGYRAELDLMENKATMTNKSYNANYHLWGDFRGKKNNHVQHPKRIKAKITKWQKYSLEVTDDHICMKVGRKVVYDILKGDFGEEWPEGQEYSLRLAFAYGGWGAKDCGLDDSMLPAEFLIDYVRFYDIEK